MSFLVLASLAASAAQTPQWDFTPTGAFSVTLAGEMMVREFGCVLVKPGWQGSFADQLDPKTVRITFTANGQRQWQGEMKGNGVSVALTQTAITKGQDLSLSCELQALMDFALETAMLRCFLPTEGNAGKARWVMVTELGEVLSGIFPATLPQPYHLFSRTDIVAVMWQLPFGWAVRFEFVQGIGSVTLQDDRQFGIPSFELQMHLKHGAWKRGEAVRAKLQLTVLSPEEAHLWEQAVRAQWEQQKMALSKQAPLRLRQVRPSATQLRRYETLEVRLDLDATYDNPFNPDQIRVEAEIVAPSGKRFSIPGFFAQDFERLGDGRRLRKIGDPYFAIRFTPMETGVYRYRIIVEQGAKRTGCGEAEEQQVVSEWRKLVVKPNPSAKGFVRRGKFWHLQFDDGTPFVPVGLNVCWSWGNRLSDYEGWFAAMREHGANFARIWLVRWNMGLEWTQGDGSGMYLGIGKYALDNAWRIDELIRIAERNGIYLMLCLGYHGELADRPLYFGEQAWEKNPYNRQNGGPCDKPADFWTNPKSKRLYKQRLRYIIARYAHSSHVVAFEFWNEVHAPADWIGEMAQFVRRLDIYGHLLTTTYGDDAVWQLPKMDFAQTHWYGDGSQRDSALTVANLNWQYTSKYRKPFLLGEFGIDWRTSDFAYDPQGNALHWHNGVWASLASRGMGTACVWYWDAYIDRLNLWHHFRPVADFVKLVGQGWLQDWQPLQASLPVLAKSPDPPFGDFVFMPSLGWQRPTGDTFTLHQDGRVEGEGKTSVFLFSPSKPDMYRPPKFVVDFPVNGKLILRVGTVSSGSLLIARVDGKEVWRQPLPEGAERADEQGRTYREGSYRERRWDAQWRKWDYIYERDFEVPIPKGRHIVEVDNQGDDWCTISQYCFTPYRNRRFGEVTLIGMQALTAAVIWVQPQDSNFQTAREGKKPSPLHNLQFTLRGLRDGRYQITVWDTWKGEVVKEMEAIAKGGKLPVHLAVLERDVALWVRAK
ncbi:MAG: hypothetical protein IMHGJWDQ_001338 [Candidatus Fervidibacter sp.]